MLKKTFFLLSLCLICISAIAQPRPKFPRHQEPPQPSSSLTLAALHHNESFMVYVDGNLLSSKILSEITIPNLSLGPHDIYVVLKYPADKITMMHYNAKKPAETFFVSYDVVHNQLELIAQAKQPHHQAIAQPTPTSGGAHICTFEEVEHWYQQIRKESFDDNRLSLAKSIVKNRNLGSHQIKRLSQAFDFDKTKVEFLKYAYSSCIDPNNYADCIEELSFESDRKQVLDFIGF